MKIGDLVRINCDNKYLNGKIGTVMICEKNHGIIYGLCVLVEGLVYGFEKHELEIVIHELTDEQPEDIRTKMSMQIFNECRSRKINEGR